MSKSHIFILSGPSGVGKNTILKLILQNHSEFQKPINYTTRSPRDGEVDGVDHFFNTPKSSFPEMLKEGELIEYVEFAGEFYGTSKTQLEESIKANKSICAEMEVDGALKVKQAFSDKTTLIFIMPPSVEALKSRLDSRHSETKQQIAKRLDRVDYEINIGKDQFDYQVINPDDHPEKAVAEIEAIIAKTINSN
ncbi:MAG: guanylate kinase [Candidatus Saccharimonadales bacterium]